MKDETITMKKSTMWQIATGILAVLLIISIFTGGFGISTGATAADVNKPSGVALVSAEDFLDDDAVLGDKNAPVTIIEFSDYQCPYCRKFWTEAYSQIKEEYIDTGKVKLIFRDFPLSFHPMAEPSAQAAECAGDQRKYYEKHKSEVQNDLGDAALSGGQGTPYFLVGDVPLSGAQPFSAFEQAIESQL